MVRPQTQICTDPDKIREVLFAELNAPVVVFKTPPVKNIYNYHPDCPYADKSTGMVLESYYMYWRFYPKDIIKNTETIGHHNKDRTDNQIENLYKKEKAKRPDSAVPNYMTRMSSSPDRDKTSDKKYRIRI